MIVDLVFYGAVLLWAITVVPAAVACCLRGQWLYFWCGWLTLGIPWYIGALGRKPGQPAYEPRRIAVALASTAAAFLALGFFGARPATVLGVDGGSLQNSVGNSLIFDSPSGCGREGQAWSCSKWDSGSSGAVPYRVKVNDLGCWQAVRVGYGGEGGSPKRLSGCVTRYDFLFT
ncbi:MAG TPA: hypothetical protein VNM38_03005 [Solirubrobacterales bacterium]|nr:hypothetical protein [Solirubrobacterales bacterium]